MSNVKSAGVMLEMSSFPTVEFRPGSLLYRTENNYDQLEQAPFLKMLLTAGGGWEK